MKYFTTSQPQSKNRVTQEFWDRPEFYKRFGFLGHEGLDLNDTPWTPTPVYAVESWVINLRNGWAYGKRIDLTYKNLMFSYCHLSKILFNTWDTVKAWELIGYTWNTASYEMPIHLHFMCAELDRQWNVVNTRNGYNGSIHTGIENWKLYVQTTKEIQFTWPFSQTRFYKWVRVRQLNRDYKKIIAWYHEWTQEIRLYDRFFTKTPERQEEVMYHEYTHHIYFSVMPNRYAKFWELISTFNPELIKTINERAKTNYTENEYLPTSRQDRIPSEEFAEISEELFRNNFKWDEDEFLHIKYAYVYALLKKYWEVE